MYITKDKILRDSGISDRTFSRYKKARLIKDSDYSKEKMKYGESLIREDVVNRIKDIQEKFGSGWKLWEIVAYYNHIFFNGIIFDTKNVYYQLQISKYVYEDYMKSIETEQIYDAIFSILKSNDLEIVTKKIKYIETSKLIDCIFEIKPSTEIVIEFKAEVEILFKITKNLDYKFKEKWHDVEEQLRNYKIREDWKKYIK